MDWILIPNLSGTCQVWRPNDGKPPGKLIIKPNGVEEYRLTDLNNSGRFGLLRFKAFKTLEEAIAEA